MLRTNARAVFISYAHDDNENADPQKRWLERFVKFLKPMVRQEDVTLYSDRDIKISADWHEHIQAQLNGAKAVVLLVSPAYLASDYIASSELPVILKNATNHGVNIFPILIAPSLFDQAKYKYVDPKTGPQEFTLASLQAANAPSKTLVEMTEGEQNRVLLKVAEQLGNLLKAQVDRSQEGATDYKMALSNVLDRNPFFTGRERALVQLQQALAAQGRAVLSGLGGVGKTQTIVEYAHRHMAVYGHVFWVSADSREALVSGYAAIARLLELPAVDSAASRAKDLAAADDTDLKSANPVSLTPFDAGSVLIMVGCSSSTTPMTFRWPANSCLRQRTVTSS
jgi:hypothetical protein